MARLFFLSALTLAVFFSFRITPVAYAVGGDEKLLAWMGNGAAPGDHSASEPGQLVYLDAQGNIVQPVLDLPEGTSRVMPCGNGASSGDGRFFAYFVGRDVGTIYIITNSDAGTAVDDDVQAMACLGNGTFQFSPDSRRFAYIAFEPDAGASEFADGWLHIFNSEDKTEVISYEGVTAFDLHNNGAAFIRFFTSDRGEADEAGIFMWNGNSEVEVATLYPDEDCKFTSGQVALVNDTSMVVMMGHKCRRGDTRTSWRFYTVDASSRDATLAMSDFQAGVFAPFARTNNLFVSPDGARVYFTTSDGITSQSVGLTAVDLANVSPDNVLVDKNAVMPKFDSSPYDFDENSAPALSSDGRWLAIVTNTPNNDATLNVFNLADANVPPIVIPAGRTGDSVTNLSFTPDNSRLVYVAGGSSSGENSLFALDLNSGEEIRIRRGRYGASVMSWDNATVAAMEWKVLEDPKEPPYLTLTLINVSDGATTTIFEGATIVDGKVTEQKFIYPLGWRRG
jgi:WD40 repeat protein